LSTGEKKFASALPSIFQVVINRLTSLVCQFELDWSACLSLAYNRPIGCVSCGCDVFGLQGYDVTAAELAINCQIEQREVTAFAGQLQSSSYDQTCFGKSGGFCPISLPLFQGIRFVCLLLSVMVVLLLLRATSMRYQLEWSRKLLQLRCGAAPIHRSKLLKLLMEDVLKLHSPLPNGEREQTELGALT
jgi:hypothetical protein